MGKDTRIEAGWGPLLGSYEEAVLTWHEQVEKAFAEARRRDPAPGSSEPVDRQAQADQSMIPLRADGSPP